MLDFRQFAPIWIGESRLRESRRLRSLRNLVHARPLRDFAARAIQRHYRNFAVSSGPKPSLAAVGPVGLALGDCVQDASRAHLVVGHVESSGPTAMGEAEGRLSVTGSVAMDSLGTGHGTPEMQLSQVLQSLESISEAVRSLNVKVDNLSAQVNAAPGSSIEVV